MAFGPAAAVYAFLVDQPAWREDCRALGALVPGPRVLDLGIGPGTGAVEMARAAPGTRHVGLDRSATMLRRAARAARAGAVTLPLVRGDALRLPVRDGALDGATGHSVLYLLPDPAAALEELHRALRPGGRVAFLEPRRQGAPLAATLTGGPRFAAAMILWRAMSRLHRRYDEAELASLLSRAGFAGARAWPVLGGHGVMATAERA
ncbi:Methyltransferase type 11 [Anaeromyxobacter dehalogenans 2CP-1]|uniref:Methyltransferase type 11 n=1 Tax=Anaeromyxobacter dehalogenans (strain ATCC BAA-258 / DSM 21875 / 2CP-1) TaxID=455488 RepID=B8JD19_ANAD2|nr:methyltransferase domain-containing protein [Anaeromyxobacter dehalogenans]ACL64047.1 Methyltransferase type 11 [Anaeromyxobacter dehalogenans 2CP-1]